MMLSAVECCCRQPVVTRKFLGTKDLIHMVTQVLLLLSQIEQPRVKRLSTRVSLLFCTASTTQVAHLSYSCLLVFPAALVDCVLVLMSC